MPTVTKAAPAGIITRHALTQWDAQVQHATGVKCLGTRLTPGVDASGDPDPTLDRLITHFDSAPDDATIDATLAAFTAEPDPDPPPEEVVIAEADTWQTIWTHAIGDGMAAKLTMDVEILCGAPASAEGATLFREAIARRRPGQGVGGVTNSSLGGASEIAGCEIQAIAAGNTVAVQLRATMPSTLTLKWQRLTCLCDPLPL
jgi:hypothetical protein